LRPWMKLVEAIKKRSYIRFATSFPGGGRPSHAAASRGASLLPIRFPAPLQGSKAARNPVLIGIIHTYRLASRCFEINT
jgi:hypothetical protein